MKMTHHTARTGMPARHAVVRKAETYVRARLDIRVPLSSLCRVAGVSERGLRNAFYGVHGVCPRRWILAERLQGVRRALADPDDTSATVTRIAPLYGFYELGRFAAIYKQAFGETPSETLRAAAMRKSSSNLPANHTKGPADVVSS